MEPVATYQSCCLHIDKGFVTLIIALVVTLCTMGLSLYKLIMERNCSDATPYYSLISSISGVAVGVLFSSGNRRHFVHPSGHCTFLLRHAAHVVAFTRNS